MPVSKQLCLLPHNGVQVLQHMPLSSLLWLWWLIYYQTSTKLSN